MQHTLTVARDQADGVLSQLGKIAWDVRENAYCPYSNYKVGAAIFTEQKKVYTGSNVENSSFGLTMCAERSALATWSNSGREKILMLIFATDSPEKNFSPCGACLQMLAEFMNPDAKVIHFNGVQYQVWKFKDLMPHANPKILG